MQNSLFSQEHDSTALSPLAHKLRPAGKSGFVGIEALEKRYPFLASATPKSLILYGPPGCGKTTLAHVLCNKDNIQLLPFSAVLSGVAELKKLFQAAHTAIQIHQRTPVIFIDEIHRFNRAQQDALLQHVESGKFILMGATTENPNTSLNKALLSRLKTVELKPVNFQDILKILTLAARRLNAQFSQDEMEIMADFSGGDARKALGNLELAIDLKDSDQFDIGTFKKLVIENSRSYDRNKDRHYDVVSAFIKSMRGSDPDAALLWLAIMLDGGEDPLFIARRLIIFASEDVGNADINGLTIASNALHAVSNIGMPEARITLAQATAYLASTVKSNAAYTAMNDALDYVKSNAAIEVPEHLKNFPASSCPVKYQYPHAFADSWVQQQYSPAATPQFYKPKQTGVEKNIINRLRQLWGNSKRYD